MIDPIELAETAALGPVGALWAKVTPFMLKAALIAGLASFCFVAGCEYHVRQGLKADVTVAHAETKAAVTKHNAGVVQTVTVYKEDLVKVRALQAANDALTHRNEQLKGLVTQYALQTHEDGGIYLSACTVRVLNNAGASAGNAGYTDPSAELAACEGTAPGTLAWGDFLQREIDLRTRFNRLRDKDNALVDWVEEHVVKTAAVPPTLATTEEPTPTSDPN